MKNIGAVVLAVGMLATASFAETDAKAHPFPISLHISKVHLVQDCGNVIKGDSVCEERLLVEAVVGGRKIELLGKPEMQALLPGEYLAALKTAAKTHFQAAAPVSPEAQPKLTLKRELEIQIPDQNPWVGEVVSISE